MHNLPSQHIDFNSDTIHNSFAVVHIIIPSIHQEHTSTVDGRLTKPEPLLLDGAALCPFQNDPRYASCI